MRRIYKYKLEIIPHQTIDMPEKAEILSMQFQNNELCIWALINDENSKADRTFEIYGTGHLISDFLVTNRKYIGTCQQNEFVWHIFELLK